MCNVLFAAEVIPWEKHVPYLREAKSYSVVCFYRYPHYFTSISVYSRWDINAKHGFATFVYQLNDTSIKTLNIPSEAGAEDSVHNGVAMGDIRLYGFNGFSLTDFYGEM